MSHQGPLLEEYKQSSRKYKWPDPRMKLLFPKVVSDKWKLLLKNYMYPEDVVIKICQKFFSEGKVIDIKYLIL